MISRQKSVWNQPYSWPLKDINKEFKLPAKRLIFPYGIIRRIFFAFSSQDHDPRCWRHLWTGFGETFAVAPCYRDGCQAKILVVCVRAYSPINSSWLRGLVEQGAALASCVFTREGWVRVSPNSQFFLSFSVSNHRLEFEIRANIALSAKITFEFSPTHVL